MMRCLAHGDALSLLVPSIRPVAELAGWLSSNAISPPDLDVVLNAVLQGSTKTRKTYKWSRQPGQQHRGVFLVRPDAELVAAGMRPGSLTSPRRRDSQSDGGGGGAVDDGPELALAQVNLQLLLTSAEASVVHLLPARLQANADLKTVLGNASPDYLETLKTLPKPDYEHTTRTQLLDQPAQPLSKP